MWSKGSGRFDSAVGLGYLDVVGVFDVGYDALDEIGGAGDALQRHHLAQYGQHTALASHLRLFGLSDTKIWAH